MMKLIKTLISAAKNSGSGFLYLLKERSFLQELLLLPFLVVFLFVFEISVCLRLYCFFSYLLILIAEALNTCVETVVDRISKEKNELSKKAKDIGSAAVFISMFNLLLSVVLAICL